MVKDYEVWRAKQANPDTIHLLHGKWQDVLQPHGQFDAVFFHTYPLDPSEHAEYVVQSQTFAAHFFPIAEKCLRPNGVFTYLTNEAESLGRGHQRLLFQHFREFKLTKVNELKIPADTRDATWSDSMVVIGARK